MYKIMGALCPKLTEQGATLCGEIAHLCLRAHLRKKVLYVMISNLCSIYIRTISRMYQIMGALWPKLAEQGDFMC